MDQVRSNHDNTARSKMERSGLGTSANDSRRSFKKNVGQPKNQSRSTNNLKADEIAALLNF